MSAPEIQNKKEILKVIVGSKAHGLDTPESDTDYRTVYLLPTARILSLGHRYKGSDWIEGKDEDNTAWELGHFLNLATKCNPTILEVFLAPVVSMTTEGEALRALFPYVWNPKNCYDAFVGYSRNQRKKLLDNKDNRARKYAVAYARVLYNLYELLRTNSFSVKIEDQKLKDTLLKWKHGEFKLGEIIDFCEMLKDNCTVAYEPCTHEPDLNKVNEFLIQTRWENYWK